jgi:sodium/potassium-transporting ATPase subunit alpha
MARAPRRLDERLLSFPLLITAYLFLGMIQAAWSMFMFFLVLYYGGWRWGQELSTDDPLYSSATGITLTSVVLMQIGNVIGRRSLRSSGIDRGLLRNPLILSGVGVEIAFSWAILYFPPFQKFLGTGAVAWQIYALAWLGIPLLFFLDLLRKKAAIRAKPSKAMPCRSKTSRCCDAPSVDKVNTTKVFLRAGRFVSRLSRKFAASMPSGRRIGPFVTLA